MDKVVDILKKTGLFLVGIVLIIWGYKSNIDKIEEEEANAQIGEQKKANGVETSSETGGSEESSGSQ